ncbi:MAG: M23 family metallopeptidase [Anaerolineae bacterium]|nr:M23 family metallopeptidase [Anaerolineae bacterium]
MASEDRYQDEVLDHQPPDWTQVAGGVIMLLIAVACVIIAGWIVFGPDDSTSQTPIGDRPPTDTLGIASVEYPTPIPTQPPENPVVPVDWVRPTADASAIVMALDYPVDGDPASGEEITGSIQRESNPLTIIPARSRSQVITYTVKKGDTLRTIAETFGLEQSSIIWSNDRFYVNAMRVGLELTILPVDGVYHHVPEPQTIASIAETYLVEPYAIIDSEFNTLYGASPETILPAGMALVVPGGEGSTEPIFWNPGIVMTVDNFTVDGSQPIGQGIEAGGGTALFAVGDPGSCGKQTVYGGSLPVSPPLYARYTISQDFSWTHGGIDLAVKEGTPVFAAGGGTVVFSGWSTWGYGYTVVVAHGSTLSIYGHLNGAFVGCGQIVEAGQNIAVTGNSGRSSGPHLHFEIRNSGGVPVSPWEYQSF